MLAPLKQGDMKSRLSSFPYHEKLCLPSLACATKPHISLFFAAGEHCYFQHMLESTGRRKLDVKPAHWLQLTVIFGGEFASGRGFWSDSQQEANWMGDRNLLLSSPIDLQIEAHLKSDSMSSIQLLNLSLFPGAATQLLTKKKLVNCRDTTVPKLTFPTYWLRTGLSFSFCNRFHASCGTASGMSGSPVYRTCRIKRSSVETDTSNQRHFIQPYSFTAKKKITSTY